MFGNLEALMFEITRRFSPHVFFARAEAVAKDILDAGFHPIGVAHTHRQSQVSALTVGSLRDLASRRWGKGGGWR